MPGTRKVVRKKVIAVDNKQATAASILRAAKITKKPDPNYNLLVYLEDGVFKSQGQPKSKAVTPHPALLLVVPFQINPLSNTGTGRYKAIRCIDEKGIQFDSKLELVSYKELETLGNLGYLEELTRQVPFSFKGAGIRHQYLPDAIFKCVKDFAIMSLKGPILFKAGEQYYCDVKSPITRKDSTFSLKKGLMKAVWGITVTIIERKWK